MRRAKKVPKVWIALHKIYTLSFTCQHLHLLTPVSLSERGGMISLFCRPVLKQMKEGKACLISTEIHLKTLWDQKVGIHATDTQIRFAVAQ